jgi:hypothetical protein
MKVMAVVAALLCALPIAAKTLNVGPSAKCKSIDAALKAAKPGDVVSVAAGFYKVPHGVSLTSDLNNVTLQGAGADRTILDGADSADDVVSIHAKGVTVAGFTLQNATTTGACFYGDINWGTINHNVIIGSHHVGVRLAHYMRYAIIDHNTFAKNDQFAISADSDYAGTEISNNIFYMNNSGELPVFGSITTGTLTHVTPVKYNCFWGQAKDSATAATSSTNLWANPQLVDPPDDCHLADGSPCLGAASDGSDLGALGKGKNPVVESPTTKGKGGK